MDTLDLFPYEWILQAEKRISSHILLTPLTHDEERGFFLKWENNQVTGSFKARGALNKILSLESWEQRKGIVAASAGNHGQGVALAGKLVSAPVIVFTTRNASPLKIEKMRALGADVRFVDGGYDQAEAAGIQYASQNNLTWVSPYNDAQIIAGQATVGLEISKQVELTSHTTVVVPVSGGGLLAGVAAALSKSAVHPKVLGVQAEASAFMHALFYRGNQDNVPDLPTIADGLSGAVEKGSITVPLIKTWVDDILLVTEDEISYAVAYAWYKYGQKIEPSAAVSLSVLLTGRVKPPAIAVISGGNITKELHDLICEHYKG